MGKKKEAKHARVTPLNQALSDLTTAKTEATSFPLRSPEAAASESVSKRRRNGEGKASPSSNNVEVVGSERDMLLQLELRERGLQINSSQLEVKQQELAKKEAELDQTRRDQLQTQLQLMQREQQVQERERLVQQRERQLQDAEQLFRQREAAWAAAGYGFGP